MRLGLSVRILLLALLPACSTGFAPLACTADGDCGPNVCELVEGQPACVPAASATLHIGMSAPLSGPEQELGTDMKLGVSLAFDAQNAAGGIRGRVLELDPKDDEYQPSLAEQAARVLADVQASSAPPGCPTTTNTAVTGMPAVSQTGLERGPDAVLAFLGNVGTPTMVRAAPVAVESGTLFFGAFTGATTILRDTSAGPCAQYIFNIRAGYAQEANATLQFFFNEGVAGYTQLVSFDQDDAFGDAGYDGLVAAYVALKGSFTPAPPNPVTPIPRYRYTRGEDSTVPPAVSEAAGYLVGLLSADDQPHVVGIMMTDTYGPASAFIQGIRQWQFANDAEQTKVQKATRLTLYFSNLSFVGPNSLAARLKAAGTIAAPQGAVAYTTNVYVSQVVPNYQSDSSDIVSDYQQQIAATGQAQTFTSLEGYIDARVFIAGLLAHQGPFTPQGLVPSFEALGDLGLGLGPFNGFSSDNHDYLTSVWGTGILSDGTFQNAYFWSQGLPIQFYQ